MPLPDFDTALALAKAAGDPIDEAYAAGRPTAPEDAALFHARWLNVRRAMHALHPDHYGDPDEIARPEEIALADTLNEREV